MRTARGAGDTPRPVPREHGDGRLGTGCGEEWGCARLLDGGQPGCGTPAGCGARTETGHPPPRERLPARAPLCRPLKARVSGQALVPTPCQLPPAGEQLTPPGDLQGGPTQPPTLLRGLPSRGGRQGQARPRPGVGLLWPLPWGLACWGAVGTRPRRLGGRVRLAPFLAPRRLLGPQTSSRLQRADTASSGVWLRGQGSGSGSQGSCLGLHSPPAQTPDPGFSPASHQWKSCRLGGSHSERRGPQRSGPPHPVEGGANPALRDWADDRPVPGPLSTSAGGPAEGARSSSGPGADTPACRANLATACLCKQSFIRTCRPRSRARGPRLRPSHRAETDDNVWPGPSQDRPVAPELDGRTLWPPWTGTGPSAGV